MSKCKNSIRKRNFFDLNYEDVIDLDLPKYLLEMINLHKKDRFYLVREEDLDRQANAERAPPSSQRIN